MTRSFGWAGVYAVGCLSVGVVEGRAEVRPQAFASAPPTNAATMPRAAGERVADFDGKLKRALKRILGPVATSASAVLRVLDLRTGAVVAEESWQPNHRIFAASSIKTLLSVAVLRRLDRIRAMPPSAPKTPLEKRLYYPTLAQQLSVQIPITQLHTNVECKRFRERRWRCHEDESGRLRGPYVRGVKRRISTLFDDMMWISSNNIAGSQLMDVAVDRGGRNELGFIRETAELITAPEPPRMQLVRKFWTHGRPGNGVLGRGDNSATALDYVWLFEEIATGRKHVLSEESRAYLKEQLRRQTTGSKLNFHWKDEATFFHKSGHSTCGLSDAGFFYLGNHKLVVMAVLAVTLDKKLMQRVGNVMLRMVEKKFTEVPRFVFSPAFSR